MRITTTNPGAVHLTTREIINNGKNDCSCDCPNLVEVNLKIKACQCRVEELKSQEAHLRMDTICECLKRSNSQSNFLKIDFVDANVAEAADSSEKRRSVLVLKLQDLDVKCENGLRHELYFPVSYAGKVTTQGDCLTHPLSSTGEINEHKPIPVPQSKLEEENPKRRNNRAPVERQISKSMDDVKAKVSTAIKSRSAQNVAAEKGQREENSMSDMDSIELIIISDEFLNESQNQEVIIVNEEKRTRSKSFQIKKNFLNETKSLTNGSDSTLSSSVKERDYFKRAAAAKAKVSAQQANTNGGKRLVIISDEFKKKSLESTVKIVKSKESKLVVKSMGKKVAPVKGKSISNAMVDLNSKIISCVLQSYEEPESLENKALEAKLKGKILNQGHSVFSG